MTDEPSNTHPDTAQRFLFEGADIRGECVQLGKSYREILDIHQYAPGVARLMGEMLAASVLLSSTLKFDGKLILQVRSEGQIPLLMAECTAQFQIRGIARGAEEATATDNQQLLTNGQLVITIEPDQGKRYQGIVPLVGDSLAESLDSYFVNSEQLGTRLWLAADGQNAAGLLLQQLPPQLVSDDTKRREQWEHLSALSETLSSDELTSLSAAALLHRLFHQEEVRVFAPRQTSFACNCSLERTRNALISLGTDEIRSLLEEMGQITMDCEFCNQQYHFAQADLEEHLKGLGSKTLH